MAKAIDDIRSEVAENTSVTAGAMALLNDLSTRIKEGVSNEDFTALAAIAADLDSNNQKLAAAIAANTPVANQPVPPAPEPTPAPDIPPA